MGAKGHEGGEQAGGGGAEARAEAEERMEAWREGKMGEPVGVLEEVVLLGC